MKTESWFERDAYGARRAPDRGRGHRGCGGSGLRRIIGSRIIVRGRRVRRWGARGLETPPYLCWRNSAVPGRGANWPARESRRERSTQKLSERRVSNYCLRGNTVGIFPSPPWWYHHSRPGDRGPPKAAPLPPTFTVAVADKETKHVGDAALVALTHTTVLSVIQVRTSSPGIDEHWRGLIRFYHRFQKQQRLPRLSAQNRAERWT